MPFGGRGVVLGSVPDERAVAGNGKPRRRTRRPAWLELIGGSGGGKYPLCCFKASGLTSVGVSSPMVFGGSGGGK